MNDLKNNRETVGSKTGMKALALMVRVLPRFVVYGFTKFLVLFYYVVRPAGRRSSAIYQRRLGFNHGAQKRFFFGLGQAAAFSHVILDNMYLGIVGDRRFHLEEHGTDIFKRALERKNGLILLSAHIGNWHLAVNFLFNTDTRVHLVIDDTRHAEVKKQMDIAKGKSGHLLLHDAAKGPDLIFELSNALRAGEIVILAGDRAVGPRRTKVSFFGKEAWFPTTAFLLSTATKAPICTALIFRTGMQRYECHGLGPFDDDVPEGVTKRNEKTDAMLKSFVSHLEKHLRRFPKQWFNFFDFWAEDK